MTYESLKSEGFTHTHKVWTLTQKNWKFEFQERKGNSNVGPGIVYKWGDQSHSCLFNLVQSFLVHLTLMGIGYRVISFFYDSW